MFRYRIVAACSILLITSIFPAIAQSGARVLLEVKAAPGTLDQAQLASLEKRLKAKIENPPKVSVVSPSVIEEWEQRFTPVGASSVSRQYYINRLLLSHIYSVAVAVIENTSRQTKETIHAYGISETIVHTHTSASIAMEIRNYFTGEVLLSRTASKSGGGKSKVLPSCIDQVVDILSKYDYAAGGEQKGTSRIEVVDL